MTKAALRLVLKQIKKRARRAVHRAFLSSEWAFKMQLKRGGARFPPDVPKCGWMDSTLKSRQQLDEAVAEVRRCGLPFPFSQKSWDALSAVKTVLERTGSDATVLDAGAALGSVPLQWLYMYGYRNLRGINLDFATTLRKGPIVYEHGDITQTRFENDSFDVALCLSVIEHGVDMDKYLAEMSRILRPSGLLITSTDYWAEPIDTGGMYEFGSPLKILTKPEIEAMIAKARHYGLKTDGEIDLECDQKAVYWQKHDIHFTFCCFCLTKAEGCSESAV